MKYLVLAALSLSVVVGCEKDHRNDNLYSSTVYFVNNASAGVCTTEAMYDVQESVEHPVYVYCSGFYGGTTEVSMAVDESVIETYNQTNNTQLKALPSECYTLDKSTATIADRKARMSVKFDVAKIMSLSEVSDFSDLSNYVLPLALRSEGDIPVSDREDGLLGYELVHPDLQQAKMFVKASEIKDGKFTLTVSLPFENQWEAAWNADLALTSSTEESTALGNTIAAKYALSSLPSESIEGGEVRSMAAGVNEVVYTFTLPTASGCYTYAFRISDAVLNGKKIPVQTSGDDEIIYVRYNNDVNYKPSVTQDSSSGDADYLGKALASHSWGAMTLVDRGVMSYIAESANNSVDKAMDGNTGSFWDNNWGGGYGTKSLPFIGVLDLGAKSDVDAVEMWRRPGTYVTDTRVVEIYAAEQCDYSDKTAIKCSGMTYLGTVDFGDSSNKERALFRLVDHVQTQYVVFNFTGSNRGGNCVSISEYNVWHR